MLAVQQHAGADARDRRVRAQRDVRLHTHLAETDDEEGFCLERFGVRPLEYMEELGWLGEDVWLAHCVHLDDARCGGWRDGDGRRALPVVERAAGPGIAPVAALVAPGAPVGLGVDGAASNEGGELVGEVRRHWSSPARRGRAR